MIKHMLKRGKGIVVLLAIISMVGIVVTTNQVANAKKDHWEETAINCSTNTSGFGAAETCVGNYGDGWTRIYNEYLKKKYPKCTKGDKPGAVGSFVQDELNGNKKWPMNAVCASKKAYRKCAITTKQDVMPYYKITYLVVDCDEPIAIKDLNTGNKSDALTSSVDKLVNAICENQGKSNSKGYKSCSAKVKPGVTQCVKSHTNDGDAIAKCTYDKFKNQYALKGKNEDEQLTILGGAAKDASDIMTTAKQCTNQGKIYRDGKCIDLVNDTGVEDKEYTSYCQIRYIGWILCPLTKFMGLISDGMFTVLQKILEIDSSSLFSTNSGAFAAFQTFLPIANIVLAIVFLFIIYSEATGNGFGAMSNYSVKKMLPKLIVFAILINLSWWLCAVAVDMSNILGANLNGFFRGASMSIGGENTPGFADIAANAIALAGAGGAAAFGGAAAILPVLGFVILAMGLVLLIMIIRQAIVVMLCVVAPIAIAMAILPGTNKVFVKWKNLFISMLIAYPAVSMLFGASQLASSIIKGDSLFSRIMAIGVLGVPLIAAPAMMFKILKGVPGIGNAISKAGDGLTKGMKSKVSDKVGNAYQHSMGNHAVMRGRSAMARGRLSAARNLTRMSQKYAGKSGLRAFAASAALGAASTAIGGRAGSARQADIRRRSGAYDAMKGRQRNEARKNAAAIAETMPLKDRMDMLTTGKYKSGQQLDNATWEALIEMDGINMTHKQNYELLVHLAERGRQIQASGVAGFQARDNWAALASTGVSAMAKSGNSIVGAPALNKMLGLTGSNPTVSSQADIDQKILTDAVNVSPGKLASMSQQQISGHRAEAATVMAAQAKADQYNQDQGLSGDESVTAADILDVSSRGNKDIQEQFGDKYSVTDADIANAVDDINGSISVAAANTLGALQYSNDTRMGMSMISGDTKDELVKIAVDGGSKRIDTMLKQTAKGNNPLVDMDKKTYQKIQDTYNGDYHPDPNDLSKVAHISEIKSQPGRDQENFDAKMEPVNENYIDRVTSNPQAKSSADKEIRNSFERSVSRKIDSITVDNIGNSDIGAMPTASASTQPYSTTGTTGTTGSAGSVGGAGNNVLKLREQYSKFRENSVWPNQSAIHDDETRRQRMLSNFDNKVRRDAMFYNLKGHKSSNPAVDDYLYKISHGIPYSGK